MAELKTLEVPVQGMDCAECALHVRQAIAALPGVESVDVLLATEKAIVRLDPSRVDLPAIREAVARAGYSVPESAVLRSAMMDRFNRRMSILLVVVFGLVLGIVVAGEWLGLFDELNRRVPLPVGTAVVIAGGFPVFRNVARAALRRQITSHTLMTVGAIAALVVGEWVAAAIVVVFMRVGDYVERFTTESARRAVRELTALAPQTARVERNGVEVEVPVAAVNVGEVVIVRPGEKIPVDGEVVAGLATVDQATITGESMPVEVAPGARVFAATIAKVGSLRVRTLRVGADTTFGRVIKMVEEAESHRGDVQRLADRFSAYYLPLVAAVALLTWLISGNALATAAVLVVACSCSFALATPVAMLASIGASAKRGLLIKGGKYLEALARADVVLVDKTGTLTLGQPQITDVVSLNGMPAPEILTMVASAERYSEHPLAEAVRAAARARRLSLSEPEHFEAVPGAGVRARVNGHLVVVGNRRLIPVTESLSIAQELEAQGKTLLWVALDGEPVALLAAADTLRPEVPAALAELRDLGIGHVELLTGDNERVAAALAARLGVRYRANLLPEDKIQVVKDYQAQGHTVLMVGDGVNDAPALAQANVGIAMGAAGTDIAIEAAHIALMREDWALIPEMLRIARRTMGVVKMNIAFTALYNLLGLTLAAVGLLPPTLAAAAQSLPDLGILANSARLLRQRFGGAAREACSVARVQ
ncbi:MAG: cation-translocating P-type ATPase [Anaerolineae bacterium]|nr:cation-translocating P-type ATPase [Anaerolineae bacterium]